jgi:hypothetical protein
VLINPPEDGRFRPKHVTQLQSHWTVCTEGYSFLLLQCGPCGATDIRAHTTALKSLASPAVAATLITTSLCSSEPLTPFNQIRTSVRLSLRHSCDMEMRFLAVFSVFTSRCSVAAFNGARSPYSGFPNRPRPQLQQLSTN